MFECFTTSFLLTDDPDINLATYTGDVIGSWFDNVFFLGSIEANVIDIFHMQDGWFDGVLVGRLGDCTFNTILGSGFAPTYLGDSAAIHIVNSYNAVAIDGWSGADIILRIDSMDDEDFLIVRNVTVFSNFTTIFMIENVGIEAANVLMTGCIGGTAVNANGVTGPFRNSVFGMNSPDCLDYSGVFGPGNKIWQDCGAFAAAAQQEALVPGINVPTVEEALSSEPTFTPPTSGGGSWV